MSFPRRELSSALEYVRQRSVITRVDDDNDERPTIYTTGVGCTQLGKLIANSLNVKYSFTFCTDNLIHTVALVVQRFGVELVIERSLVRLPAGALSRGQLSLPSLRGR